MFLSICDPLLPPFPLPLGIWSSDLPIVRLPVVCLFLFLHFCPVAECWLYFSLVLSEKDLAKCGKSLEASSRFGALFRTEHSSTCTPRVSHTCRTWKSSYVCLGMINPSSYGPPGSLTLTRQTPHPTLFLPRRKKNPCWLAIILSPFSFRPLLTFPLSLFIPNRSLSREPNRGGGGGGAVFLEGGGDDKLSLPSFLLPPLPPPWQFYCLLGQRTETTLRNRFRPRREVEEGEGLSPIIRLNLANVGLGDNDFVWNCIFPWNDGNLGESLSRSTLPPFSKRGERQR